MYQQQTRRLNVLSWLSPFVALALLAFLLTSSIGQTQNQNQNQIHGHYLICTVSSFYSIDANEQVAGEIRIEGRGLANCKSDQGVSTDIPVSSVITAKAVGNWANAGELSFSANSASFVIPRELNQMQDVYDLRPYAFDMGDKRSPTALFAGSRNGVMIEMHFSSATQALSKIDVSSMALHFDDSAPTLD